MRTAALACVALLLPGLLVTGAPAHRKVGDQADAGDRVWRLSTANWDRPGTFGHTVAMSGSEAERGLDVPIKLFGTDPQEFAHFGKTVALSGTYLVVGAPGGDGLQKGALHVFERSGESGAAWEQVVKLIPPPEFKGARFADAVDIDGDRVVVGAPWSLGGFTARGAVFFLERSEKSGQWEPDGWLEPPETEDFILLGRSVGISGDFAVAGADLDDFGGIPAGSAYVFHRSMPGPAWRLVDKLRASDVGLGFNFGIATDIEGDLLVVGDTRREGVYVFERIEDGTQWEETALLTSLETAGAFGGAVAISGETILVGDEGDRFWEGPGAAHVFERGPDGEWHEVAKLVGLTAEPSDDFGTSVALDGDLAVVGMNVCPVEWPPCDDPGSVYVFSRDEGGADAWGEVAELTISAGLETHKLGNDVALSRGVVVAGAHKDHGLFYEAGATFVYEPEECVLELELDRTRARPGEIVRIGIHLEHRALRTVVVPFLLWIEDARGAVVAELTALPRTFTHGEATDHHVALTVPADVEPGEYFVKIGIEGMQQGVAAAQVQLWVSESGDQ